MLRRRILFFVAACSLHLLAAAPAEQSSHAAADDAWEDGQHGAPPSQHAFERLLPVSCSRSSSRTAKKIFSSYLDVVYGDTAGQKLALANASLLLGATCPFGAGNGLFDDQEALKKQHRHNQWHCSACDKYFKSEAYLDQHFDNRHAADLGKGGRRHCLADFCGILGGCGAADARDEPVCNTKVAARLRHSCSLLVSSCFPSQAHSDPALAELSAVVAAKFRAKFCSALSCDRVLTSDDGDGSSFWERSRFVLFVILLIVVAVFYFGLYLSHADTRVRDDISSLGSRYRMNRDAVLKEKAY